MLVPEFLRVLVAAPRIERLRRTVGPKIAMGIVRRDGAKRAARGWSQRRSLARAVALVDRLFPTGPNCYRRVLLEAALDAGAAREPLMMGFRTDGRDGRQTGHAWLGNNPPASSYDVIVSA